MTKITTDLQVSVRFLSERRVSGWIVRLSTPKQKFGIRVRIGDYVSDPILANMPRNHLAERGIGDGAFGFELSLPPDVPVTPDGVLEILLSDSLIPVAKLSLAAYGDSLETKSNASPAEKDDTAGFKSRVSLHSGRRVSGWIVRPSTLEQKHCVRVRIGDYLSDPIMANEPRNHLVERGFGDGAFGFEFVLPPDVSVSSESLLEVVLADSLVPVAKRRFAEFGDSLKAKLKALPPPLGETPAHAMSEETPESRDTYLQSIRALEGDGNGILALREAVKASLLFPSDDELRHLRDAIVARNVDCLTSMATTASAEAAGPESVFRLELSADDKLALDEIAGICQEAGNHALVVDLLEPLSAGLGVELLLRYGASLRSLGKSKELLQVLSRILKMDPGNPQALERLRDHAMDERDFALAFHYNSALIAHEGSGRHRLAQARIYVALGCQGYQYGHYLQPVPRDQAFSMALTILNKIVEKNAKEHRAWGLLGQLYSHFGNVERAEAALAQAFRVRPNATTGLALARLQLNAGRIAEALSYCDKTLAIARSHPVALYLRRFLSNEAFSNAPPPAAPSRALTVIQAPGWTLPQQTAETCAALGLTVSIETFRAADEHDEPTAARQVAALADANPDRWFVVPVGEGPTPHDLACFAAGMSPRRTAVWSEFAPGVAPREVLVRGHMLASILRGFGEEPLDGTLAEAIQRRSLHLRSNLPPRERTRTKVAWIVSRYGHVGFGGVERFMENIASVYRDEGYDGEIVGVLPAMAGQSGQSGQLRWSFVGSPIDLRDRAIAEGVDVVHLVGMSYEIMAALDGLETRLVYGFHFFRDLFVGYFEDAYFPYFNGSIPVRAESHVMLADLSVFYANSDYSREVIERSHGARVPTVYSVSYDEPANPKEPGDAILLMNARMDKGFGLLLEMAARLPHRKFVAVASQSPRVLAERMVALRGLKNVVVLDRTDDIDGLYERARVVVVPSFAFVETFSRVVVEAQARGRVVLGALAGNIPNLIDDSRFVLPEDPALWAERAEAMFSDEAAYQSAVAAARANAARFGPELFRAQSRRLVRSIGQRILVGVGSGVGNTLHATPLIRRISEHFGVPVDVVFSEGGRSYFDLVDNPDIVGSIFEITPLVLAKPYDIAFMTNSFGTTIPDFNASIQMNSRDTDRFLPGHSAHETIFNLDMGTRLLGIPRIDGDEFGYFVGTLDYVRPETGIVGFHGGSKGDHWISKRWPHYEELAQELLVRGHRVVSLGVREELVPGTEDWTGGTIGQMTKKMLQLDYLVTNDSGVMNIGNALGIPLTAIFAPTDVRTRAPRRPTSRVVAIAKGCAPCEVKNPTAFRSGLCACIGEIPLEQVLATVSEGMAAAGRLSPQPQME